MEQNTRTFSINSISIWLWMWNQHSLCSVRFGCIYFYFLHDQVTPNQNKILFSDFFSALILSLGDIAGLNRKKRTKIQNRPRRGYETVKRVRTRLRQWLQQRPRKQLTGSRCSYTIVCVSVCGIVYQFIWPLKYMTRCFLQQYKCRMACVCFRFEIFEFAFFLSFFLRCLTVFLIVWVWTCNGWTACLSAVVREKKFFEQNAQQQLENYVCERERGRNLNLTQIKMVTSNKCNFNWDQQREAGKIS